MSRPRLPASPVRGGFLSGVSLLGLSAVLVKLIGLFYRVPLLDTLGTEGMGWFNTALELYALCCVLSTAGLPVAMSVLLAETGDDAAGRVIRRRVLRLSLTAFTIIGTAGTLLLLCLSGPLARLLGNPPAAYAVAAAAPTLWFICLSSACRGWFQGRHVMLPTAVSQVIEALGKLILGLAFAALSRARGNALPVTAAWAAAGLTVGTAVSSAYLAVSCRRSVRRDALSGAESMPAGVPDDRTLLRRLAACALPVTLSAGVISLSKCVDLALILRRLQDTGMDASAANALWGCYSTLAVPVFNILPSLSSSVALPAVPALSASLARVRRAADGDARAAAREDVRRTAAHVWRLTLWLSVPAGLGLCVFAGDILSLLFAGQPEAAAMAAPWLRVLGLSVPSACLITVCGGMLQAAGAASRPVIAMAAGLGVKVCLSWVLLGIPSVGIMGAPVGTLACDAVIAALDVGFLARRAPELLPRPCELPGLFALPLGASLLSLAVTLCLRARVTPPLSAPARTMGEILCVVLLYGALMGLCLLLRPRRRDRRVCSIQTYRKEKTHHGM